MTDSVLELDAEDVAPFTVIVGVATFIDDEDDDGTQDNLWSFTVHLEAANPEEAERKAYGIVTMMVEQQQLNWAFQMVMAVFNDHIDTARDAPGDVYYNPILLEPGVLAPQEMDDDDDE